MSASRDAMLAQLARCFRHQHPEAFDRAAVGMEYPPEVQGIYRDDDPRPTPPEFAEPSDRGRADAVGIWEEG